MADATQPGAPTDEPTVPSPPPYRPGMDEIIANRRKALGQEGLDMEALQASPDASEENQDKNEKSDDDTGKPVTAAAAGPEDLPAGEQEDEARKDPKTEPPAAAEPPTTEGDKPSEAQPGDADDDEDLVEVNVLGKIEKVSRQELVRGYQTARAANQRFEEASRLRNEADQRIAEAQSLRDKPPADAAADAAATDDASAGDTAAKAALVSAFNRVRYGDDEEVDAAADEVLTIVREGRGDATPKEIVDDVIAQVLPAMQHHTQEQEVMRKLDDDFPEVLQDADLLAVATNKTREVRYEDLLGIGHTNEQLLEFVRGDQGVANLIGYHQRLQAEGKVRSEHDVLREACVRTQKWQDDLRGTPSAPNPDDATPPAANRGNGAGKPGTEGLAQRAARKATMPQHPQASAAATTDALGGAEKPPPKASDVVAAIKAQRPGQ